MGTVVGTVAGTVVGTGRALWWALGGHWAGVVISTVVVLCCDVM